MEEERRRRSLTPLSGELQVTEHVSPGHERTRRRIRLRRRRDRPPPQAFREMLVRGLTRAAVILTLVGGIAIGVAFLVGRSRDWDTARSISLGLYVGGAALMAGAFFLSSSDMGSWDYKDAGERATTVSSGLAYIFLGACLIALGYAAETLL